ncbi:hypothetical protein [Eubacterium ramulus]|uniref:hypothetical protein n=1 Tax=Eubacterium ramulus TaxID=39490 RepID=UPI00399A5FF3
MNEEMKQQVLSKLLEAMIDPDSLPETINEYTEKAKPLIRATGKQYLIFMKKLQVMIAIKNQSNVN